MNAQEMMICKLEKLEKYVQELEDKLKDYETVVAERDSMQNKTSIGLTLLDSMKNKQTCMFNEIIGKHDDLCKKYELTQEQLKTLNEENDCLLSERKQLSNKIKDQELDIENLNIINSNLQRDAQKLQKQLDDVIETTNILRVSQQQTESKLKEKEQKIICVKNNLAEEMARISEFENKIRVEQAKGECLRSSESNMQTENEKIVRSLQMEINSLRDQCDENLTELVKVEQQFNDKQQECGIQNDQLKNLKGNINDLREAYEKEKSRANEEICCLTAEAKSLSDEIALINTKLNDVRSEHCKLQSELEEQIKTIKKFTLIEDEVRQEVNRNKLAIELATQKLKAERKQRTNEIKLNETKSLMKAQEKSELRQFIEDQGRQIKILKMQIAEVRPTAVRKKPKENFTSVLSTYLELLCDDDEDDGKMLGIKND